MNNRKPSNYVRNVFVTLVSVQLFGVADRAVAQLNYNLLSPDKRIELRIRTGDRIRYDVVLNGKMLLQDSTLSLKTSSTTLGLEPRIKSAKNHSVHDWIEPVVRQKFAKVRENYNELRLEMENAYAVDFRVFNEGVAYRLETSLPQQ